MRENGARSGNKKLQFQLFFNPVFNFLVYWKHAHNVLARAFLDGPFKQIRRSVSYLRDGLCGEVVCFKKHEYWGGHAGHEFDIEGKPLCFLDGVRVAARLNEPGLEYHFFRNSGDALLNSLLL